MRYLRTASTRDVVLDHLKTAENCHKDPEELAAFIDALYLSGVERWDLVEASVSQMVALLDRAGADGRGAFRPDAGPQMAARVERFVDKLRQGRKPPPGVLMHTSGVWRYAGGVWIIVDGRHRILAAKRAGKESFCWWVPWGQRIALDRALRVQEEEAGGDG